MAPVQIAVVSTSRVSGKARATVRSAQRVAGAATVVVLDLDGSYLAVRDELVVRPADLGVTQCELHVRSMLLGPYGVVRWIQPTLLRQVLTSGTTALAVGAGVLLLADPSELTDLAAAEGACVLSRSAESLPADGRWPGAADLLEAGSYSPHLVAVSRAALPFLDLWEQLAVDPSTASDRWLDAAASRFGHATARSARFLVSAWTGPSARISTSDDGTLEIDGAPAVALDLTGLEPDDPWLLDASADGPPRLLLSAHAPLALLAARFAAQAREESADVAGSDDAEVTSLGVAVHPQLRSTFLAALDESPSRSIDALPDPFARDGADALARWLVEPGPGDLGLGRYVAGIYRARPDLQATFPGIPGAHAGGLLDWANTHGRHESAYSAALIDLTLAAAHRPEPVDGPTVRARRRQGVNVVGYLQAELGVGESARLMLSALASNGIPHATASVDRYVQSRQGASFAASATTAAFDTTLLCVNADMTSAVAATVPTLVSHSYRIGMWYWEVEDFPASQHDAFDCVDEVWVATDFVRRAVEPHSPVPVRTITPPLPQPRSAPERTRADLGLPERPYFLFSFDFLSTVERKNPWGLVEAFEAAFGAGEGPLLVIKSINADRRPADAERLRLRVAGSADVLLLEEYLDAEDRDALVALCDCYVSLHRSEGLGLTMAEAMAWGKPVIATGYSGNLQFMTDENSFLVPWRPTAIPAGAEPYPAGGVWAEPDLESAARLMRAVVDSPEVAAARGARAVADLVALHSPEVAGRRIAARLAETTARRRARSRLTVAARLRVTARAARRSLS